MKRVYALRPDNFQGITRRLLLHLQGRDMVDEKRDQLIGEAVAHAKGEQVRWGRTRDVVKDVIGVINIGRRASGRPSITEGELISAIYLYHDEQRSDHRVEELTDALANVREMRLGVNKFAAYPPMDDKLRQTG